MPVRCSAFAVSARVAPGLKTLAGERAKRRRSYFLGGGRGAGKENNSGESERRGERKDGGGLVCVVRAVEARRLQIS